MKLKKHKTGQKRYPQHAVHSTQHAVRIMNAVSRRPCHWLFTIYDWLLLCALCGITKNAVLRRFIWN